MYRLLLLGLTSCAGLTVGAEHDAEPAKPELAVMSAAMADAASIWLTSLEGDARSAANPAFESDLRKDWHFVPRERAGIAFKDMTPEQSAAATAMLEAGLSEFGAEHVQAIMALETILRDLGGDPVVRDPDNYAFLVFGEPGVFPWGWRVEGHHLSLHMTLASATDVSVTPAFVGSNPGRYPDGDAAGTWVQSDAFDHAVAFAASLSDAQWAVSQIGGDPVGEIVALPGEGDVLESDRAGIAFSALDAAQQGTITALIESYVGLAHDAVGTPYMELVRAHLGSTYIAWAGGREAGDPFYYRIHGPRILIEYDNSRDGGNHVHAVWRDPLNDFGHDDLRRHLEDAH